jgi:integrase
MEVQSAYLKKRGKRFQGVLSWKDGDKWRQTTRMLQSTTKTAARRELTKWQEEEEKKESAAHGNSSTVLYVRSFIGGLEKSHRIEPSTVKDYRKTLRVIERSLGDAQLSALTSKDVQHWEEVLVHSGLSPVSVGKAHRLLKEALSHAVDVGDLRANPVAAVRPPKRPASRPNALDSQARKRLVSAINIIGDSRLTIAVRLALYCGTRISEVCGLKWEDIENDFSRLWVRRSIGRGMDGLYIKEPKTGKIRDVPISQALAEHLKAYKNMQFASSKSKGVAPSDAFFVVGNSYGGYCSPDIISHEWRALSSSMSLIGTEGRICTFHDLRHTFATAAIAAGVDVKTVSSILGHANAAMTLNVYASADPDAKKRAADIIERAI